METGGLGLGSSEVAVVPSSGNGSVFVPMSAPRGEKQAFRASRPSLAETVSTQLGR